MSVVVVNEFLRVFFMRLKLILMIFSIAENGKEQTYKQRIYINNINNLKRGNSKELNNKKGGEVMFYIFDSFLMARVVSITFGNGRNGMFWKTLTHFQTQA